MVQTRCRICNVMFTGVPEWFVVQGRDILRAQLEGRPRQITNPLIASMFTQGAMSQQHSWFPWQGCRQLICYDICAYCKQPCWFLCSTFKVSILLRHFHCNITPCQYVNTLHCLWQLTVFCRSSAYKSSDKHVLTFIVMIMVEIHRIWPHVHLA